eukprot:PhM_4_TR15952/c2_g1_i3/m.102823
MPPVMAELPSYRSLAVIRANLAAKSAKISRRSLRALGVQIPFEGVYGDVDGSSKSGKNRVCHTKMLDPLRQNLWFSDDTFCQGDNSKFSRKMVRLLTVEPNFLEESGRTVNDNTPRVEVTCSPDLNPIENLWRMLKNRKKNRVCAIREELEIKTAMLARL